MKTSALLPLLLLVAACASSDGFIDERVLDCAPGQDVTIQAGIDTPGVQMERIDDQLTLLVEVANNTHDEIVVTFIRAEQVKDDAQMYRIESGYGKFDQTIEEGGDHVFRIPMTGRMIAARENRTMRLKNAFQMSVSVGLSNGDVYRCLFELRPPV